ncbi:hypothetical protein SDC9_151573 [bioreactor metagenome]|uniref:Uncharacterized protein n=1 Tax=bioreactor metagenome TaxID=1076179 RepID=A0A645ESB5_9ZZZZ
MVQRKILHVVDGELPVDRAFIQISAEENELVAGGGGELQRDAQIVG